MKRVDVHPKVKAGYQAGAVGVVLVWVLAQFGIVMPPEVAGAVVLLAQTGAAYAKAAH